MQELIEKLYIERNKAGMSVVDLSETLNVAPNTIKAWESGKSEPRLSQFKEWLAVFGYEIEIKKLTR